MEQTLKITIPWVDRWEYQVRGVSRDVSEINKNINLYKENNVLLLLITEGEGNVEFGNRSLSASCSDFFFLPMSKFKKLDEGLSKPIKGKYIVFEFLDQSNSLVTLKEYPRYVRKVNNLVFIAQLMDRIISMHYRKGRYKASNATWMRTLMYELAVIEGDVPLMSGVALENYLKIENICERIKHHPSKYDIKIMASEFHSTIEHFSRVFKKLKKVSPQEYLIQCRMDWAKSALMLSKKTVALISYEVGYKTPQFFVKIFKKRIGMTPNQYRKSKLLERM